MHFLTDGNRSIAIREVFFSHWCYLHRLHTVHIIILLVIFMWRGKSNNIV